MKWVIEIILFSENYYKNMSTEMNRTQKLWNQTHLVSHSASTPYQLDNFWQFISSLLDLISSFLKWKMIFIGLNKIKVYSWHRMFNKLYSFITDRIKSIYLLCVLIRMTRKFIMQCRLLKMKESIINKYTYITGFHVLLLLLAFTGTWEVISVSCSVMSNF